MLKKAVLTSLLLFLFASVASAGFAWQEHVDNSKFQLVGHTDSLVAFFDTTTIKLKRDNDGVVIPHMIDVWMIHYFTDETDAYKRRVFYSGYINEDVQSKYFLIHKIYDTINGTEAILSIEEYDEYGMIYKVDYKEVYIPIMPDSINKMGLEVTKRYAQANYAVLASREDKVVVEGLPEDEDEYVNISGSVW